MSAESICVIVSTYNSPDYLEKVLWALACQSRQPDEVIVADDGSDEATRAVTDAAVAEGSLRLKHVWHPHQGFRKCVILNKAIAAARSEYLVFIDGDCVTRSDFIAVHAARASAGRFLSGGVFRLPRPLSKALTREEITGGDVFRVRWLWQHGVHPSPLGRLGVGASTASVLSRLTTTRATFNGHNSSAWRSDVERVNGFDERMEYGGLDRELGERLENAGVRGAGIRYEAICVHLDHDRGYVRQESLAANRAIRQTTRDQNLTWTPYGLVKAPRPGS